MKKDIITLCLVFVTGLFSGAYLYVTAFASQFSGENISEKSKSEVVISGEMYGGCVLSGECASFRLTDNRAYQYLSSKEASKEKGSIPDDLIVSVLDHLTVSHLNDWSSPTAVRNCRSYVDGVDYKYTVSFEGKNYTLDTCKTKLPHDSAFQKVLLDVWRYMENPTTTYPVIIEKGIVGWLIDRLQNSK